MEPGGNFKDYDQAINEVEDKWYEFRFGGEDFKVNLNVDGALVLRWMENSSNMAAIVSLTKELMGEDDYKRLLGTGQSWPKYEMLLTDFFTMIGGPGNVQ